MDSPNTLILDHYFPSDVLKITEVIETEKIIIHMKSITKTCICPRCHQTLEHYHGTYIRKVQDLPILGKNVQLQIKAHEYICNNEACPVRTVAETFNGFLNANRRMTQRCEDFICMLALETSCEGCARICQAMNLYISGDSVIRFLTERYEAQPAPVCGETIGVDDFAFKKRSRYGTVIVDEATHRPVAVLNGRDSNTLKAWLRQNRQVKRITRDRAGAYASAIGEILPDAMQIADRFHLHQNLLVAVQNVLKSVVPADIKIPVDQEQSDGQHPEEKTATEGLKKK
ncbi:transposase [Acetobacterium bakii]|uniref:Transposase n=2 Tax=Acetobacterium bakii TaxID=52689 RepID=A0A0L6TV49_9FIRM|nr:transposase [Acetobacterium bakii]KNZ40151.1 transposase [Acetobacterium bakii]